MKRANMNQMMTTHTNKEQLQVVKNINSNPNNNNNNNQEAMQNSDQTISQATQQQLKAASNQTSLKPANMSINNNNNNNSNNGRARKLQSNQHQASALVDPSELFQDELRELQQFRNAPPLFVTATRDYFVDAGRFPIGFKLATMQAIDPDGDRIEYRLEPASLCDASSQFSINPITGELRLAGKKFSSSNEDDEDDEDDGQKYSPKGQCNQYFLMVVANDGKYDVKVELQIHVFDKLALGNSGSNPIQLTPEGSRAGIEKLENLIRSKTDKFLNELTHTSTLAPPKTSIESNLTLVFPNFVNPISTRHQLTPESETTTFEAPTGISSSGQHEHDSNTERDLLTTNKLKQSPTSYVESTTMDSILAREEPMIVAQTSPANLMHHHQPTIGNINNGQTQLDNPLQQQMVLSVAIIICSCLIIALVLLLFIVPLSVKRLRKRLKTVESSMQHDCLSHKNSNASSSIVCSSILDSSTTSKNYQHHVPSPSQFTLASTTSTRAAESLRHVPPFVLDSSQLRFNFTNAPSQHHQHAFRQSSLDSALDQALAGAGRSGLPSMQGQQFVLPNGISRVNNGSILNPTYLHQQQQHQHQQQNTFHNNTNERNYNLGTIHRKLFKTNLADGRPFHGAINIGNQNQASDINNYSLIDDEYSTINTETTALAANDNVVQQQVASSIVGQTSDSRAYLGAQSAQQYFARDRSSSCGSRSSARFLTLSAQDLDRFQRDQIQRISSSSHQDNESDEAEEKSKQTAFIEFDPLWCRRSPKGQDRATRTIARTDKIDRAEPQFRSRRRHQEMLSYEWEINCNRLIFLELLGEGQFGQVWRAKLGSDLAQRDHQRTTTSTIDLSGRTEKTVAVKALKRADASNERERKELLDEIETMRSVCEHPNVVKILHCCTHDIDRPIFLVMEFVELGNLQRFLERSRLDHKYSTTLNYIPTIDNDLQQQHSPIETPLNMSNEYRDFYMASEQRPDNHHLTSRDLIKFIYHIAEGMKYISSKGIVHRDLASRNILISSSRICKIGDFGMARHIDSSEGVYERRSKNTKIPVRWMAPEVLLNNSFTFSSDVFSFGILMWEIVTLGSTPYPHLKTELIIDAVARQGERPRKPDYCHSLMFNLMSECWSSQVEERPTFGELVVRLDGLLRSSDEYIELDQYPDHNYYNIPARSVPNELV